MLPEGFITISIDQRDPLGYYSIGPRATIVYPFNIPLLGYNAITMTMVNSNAQDFSLRVWFSTSPLDGVIDFNDNSLNPYYLTRRAREMVIWDELVIPPPTPIVPVPFGTPQPCNPHYKMLSLPSSPTYYINIENMQNLMNAYRLTFTY
jgi:hypothetical protein